MDMGNHGGGCCGIKHVFNMDNSTEADLDRLLREACPPDNDNRLVEITLNSRQVAAREDQRNPAEGWPTILARKGFRLVSRFRNSNTGNDVYIFHFVPQFLSIQADDMTGHMQQWPADYVAPDTSMTVRRSLPVAPVAVAGQITVGSRVRTNGRGNAATQDGDVGTVTALTPESPYQTLVTVSWDRLGYSASVYLYRLTLIEEIAVVAPEPTVVFSTYHNSYRDFPRGAGYDTLEAAITAAPRCRQRDRRDIFSDGTVLWSENI